MRLAWRGRWGDQRTLRHYIQEVAIRKVLDKVPSDRRAALDAVLAWFEEALEEFQRPEGLVELAMQLLRPRDLRV